MSVPQPVLRRLDKRDERVCVLTGYRGDRIVPQHRQGGMGGRPDKHTLPNLLWIDSLPNGFIESDRVAQLVALVSGVKVPGWADATQVPVWYAAELGWFRLTGDTRTPLTSLEAHEAMHDVYGDKWAQWKLELEQTPHASARLRAWAT